VAVGIDGTVTINGGNGAVSSTLVSGMAQCGQLTKRIVQMVQNALNIARAWNSNAIQVMYDVGFPRTCMMNMDPQCSTQFMGVMQLSVLNLFASAQSLT
jgi:hypothetical protein